MFERFSREAREVVRAAEAEATDLGSPTIEAEHLLLALTDRVAALPAVGLDRDGVLTALEAERDRSLAAVGVSATGFEPSPLAGRPRFATSAKSALELALREALTRGDRRILPGHLLLGVVRPQAGTVPRALEQAGVDRDDLRARTAAEMDR
ncbi:MAG TPA: Clp protease N-terminal domain-containing protein [Solirubrobacteraceae bacterium]|jgi:ATP-dependent Clp protease ATP-binding subunit ClpA|nr:Clp protease N-terminal domain-containing protein [Solirubrobacteraceae bacterium]